MEISGATPPFCPSAIPLRYGTLLRSRLHAPRVYVKYLFQIKRNPKHQGVKVTIEIKGDSNLLGKVCLDEALYLTGNYTSPVTTAIHCQVRNAV